mgnify:FL=1
MSDLIDKTSDFVTKLLAEKLPETCLYHNLTHTRRVVKSIKEIIAGSSLNQGDNEILVLAAFFHDVGYIEGALDHEKTSAIVATEFLSSEGVDANIIEKVSACILATKITSIPTTELEKIIRDADASHFAKDYFQEASEFLRKELKLQKICSYSKSQWLNENIKMLQTTHTFYTDYAKENWQTKKEKNIDFMMDEKQRIKKEKMKKKELVLKQKLKADDPDKAIQSVFRITLKNHIKLSDIADTKANILLSVNAIIISIALSNLIPKLDNPSNSYLIVPTMIFLLFTVTAIILSVLATRPNVTSGKFTKEDVVNKKVNLLFFGNFHKMSLTEFDWAMQEMLNDKDYIYSSMTKDLYFLGLVLQKKYSILRLTYTIFMAGIIISVIAFAVAFHFAGTNV